MLFAPFSVTTRTAPPWTKAICSAPGCAVLSGCVEPAIGTRPAGSTVKPVMLAATVALPALST